MICFICSITLLLLSSSVFVHCPNWCVYFQILYNTMDFCKWKMNLVWSCKWIICKRITAHTCWGVCVLLTHHIKFCMCDDSKLKKILVRVGVCACNRMSFINRPVAAHHSMLLCSLKVACKSNPHIGNIWTCTTTYSNWKYRQPRNS